MIENILSELQNLFQSSAASTWGFSLGALFMLGIMWPFYIYTPWVGFSKCSWLQRRRTA